MNVNFVKRWFYVFTDFFPTKLPVGLTAFNNWSDRLLFTYFPPSVTPPETDSFRFSIAAMVMHLDSQSYRKSNRFFGKAIRKGASNEVASFVMHDLKDKREALIKTQQADALRKQLENTPTQTQADATASGTASSGQTH